MQMQIDYAELAKYLAQNTPAPQNAAEMTVYGIALVLLCLGLVGSWMFFIWWMKKKETQEDKIAESLTSFNTSIVELNVHLKDRKETHKDIMSALVELKLNIAELKNRTK